MKRYAPVMMLRCLVPPISCGLLCAAAATYNAPQFTLSHTGSQPGFTDIAPVKVAVTYPLSPHPGTLWCITQDPTLEACQSASNWITKPQQFALTGGNGLNKVYLEYKYGGTVSAPGEAEITLDQQVPVVALSAPTGLPGAVPGGRQQMIGVSPQFITGAVSDAVATDPVTLSLYACNQESTCTNVNTIPQAAAPFVWPWPAGDVFSDTTYIKIEAVNAAGKSSSTTVPNPTTVFSIFTPASLTSPITCSAAVCPAVSVANDPPSIAVDGTTFTGFADPSMRRDPAVGSANPNGTKLWMLYSHPQEQANLTYGTASPMVEIHLASSMDAGNSWKAWCTPSPCTQETPVWPAYHWLAAAGQKEQFSSHEVANFWPYSSDSVNWKWYAVHLMYFVQPPNGVTYGITNNGCLVTTVAPTPYGLGAGWAGTANAPPISCTASMPAGSQAVTYASLSAAAGSHVPNGVSCVWGEPAILVQNGTAYLATQCFDPENFYGYGYFIFASALGAGGGLTGAWNYYGGPFYAPNVKHFTPKATFVTEFDWAERSDHTLVAVVTPASIANHLETQYGCVALDFTLTSGFGDALVAMNDQDVLETQGPNACTYEPTSNTGMLIVRRLVNGPNNTAWSLVATGVMP